MYFKQAGRSWHTTGFIITSKSAAYFHYDFTQKLSLLQKLVTHFLSLFVRKCTQSFFLKHLTCQLKVSKRTNWLVFLKIPRSVQLLPQRESYRVWQHKTPAETIWQTFLETLGILAVWTALRLRFPPTSSM